MTALSIGVCLWALVHLMPALSPDLKQTLVGKLTLNGYKLAFTISVFVALGLIITGWRSTAPEFLYHFGFARHVTYLLMLLAVACLVAAKAPTHLRRWLRHPQLTGVFLWASAHLLVNGDSRSLVLFGGFAIWSVLEMLLINKRDGKPEIPTNLSFKADVIVAVVTVVMVAVLIVVHPYIAGVPLIRA